MTDCSPRSKLADGLLATLIEHAQSAGVQQIVGVVLATNGATLGLARSMSFSVNTEPGHVSVLRIRRDLAAGNTQLH